MDSEREDVKAGAEAVEVDDVADGVMASAEEPGWLRTCVRLTQDRTRYWEVAR